jgi:hypothetical protein
MKGVIEISRRVQRQTYKEHMPNGVEPLEISNHKVEDDRRDKTRIE